MNGLSTPIKINRRQALAIGAVGAAAAFCWWVLKRTKEAASLFNIRKDDNSARGHLVRAELNTETLHRTHEIETLIIGSGISGLSTAWFLEKKNYKKYLVLEADHRVGGNAAFAENELSQYPLGAHYLPIIRNDDPELLAFLQEIGVVTGIKGGLPIYNEEYLCHAPSERLFIKGRWQEGLIPQYAGDQTQLAEMKNFLEYVEVLRNKKGRDGRFLFSIPVDQSSTDPEWTKLDSLKFTDFLNAKGWNGEYLTWYVNYCCRDDFGLNAEQTSAWAGLHYFCSRNGKAFNSEVQSVLTWPQGNGFLVQQLTTRLSKKVQTEATVRKVIRKKNHFEVYYSDAELKTVLVRCKHLVYAIPKAVVKYIQPELELGSKTESYPWLVTNIQLKKSALDAKLSLCWDNVRFGSESLGYINSSHQLLQQNPDEVNITFYYSFSNESPSALRRELGAKSETELFSLVVKELVRMHPNVEPAIQSVHVKLWGHGMIAPRPGYIWGARLKNNSLEPRDIIFAHTERAGVSVFEEGFHQGLNAASRILKAES